MLFFNKKVVFDNIGCFSLMVVIDEIGSWNVIGLSLGIKYTLDVKYLRGGKGCKIFY